MNSAVGPVVVAAAVVGIAGDCFGTRIPPLKIVHMRVSNKHTQPRSSNVLYHVFDVNWLTGRL